jgi:hypothetical protein
MRWAEEEAEILELGRGGQLLGLSVEYVEGNRYLHLD